MVVGYSLAFGNGGTFIGDLSRLFLGGIGWDKPFTLGEGLEAAAALTIPETVFMVFQMTFAIITPALISGAFADRMKFSALLWFMGLWSLLVYAPIAHWVWHPDGFLFALGRARLRRRHGRPHQRRHRRPGRGARARQAPRLRP